MPPSWDSLFIPFRTPCSLSSCYCWHLAGAPGGQSENSGSSTAREGAGEPGMSQRERARARYLYGFVQASLRALAIFSEKIGMEERTRTRKTSSESTRNNRRYRPLPHGAHVAAAVARREVRKRSFVSEQGRFGLTGADGIWRRGKGCLVYIPYP